MVDYKETEKRLYTYYINKTKVKNLEKEIEEMDVKIKRMENDIKNNNVTLEEQNISINWEERVQSSTNTDGYPEKELMRQIGLLEKNLRWLNVRKLKKIQHKHNLELSVNRITYILENLDEEQLRLVEMKYGDKEYIEKIAMTMNIGRRTVYRMLEKIIEEVGKLLS